MALPKVGDWIGPYRLDAELGGGGFAVVFKAHDSSLDRDVALKVLRPEVRLLEKELARFKQEGRRLARLEDHPNIVKVYFAGEQDDQAFIALKYIPGTTFEQRLARPISLAEVERTVSAVASALDYAHEHGIYHRDIKPSNVLLDQAGRIYLSDFGIAKVVGSSESSYLHSTSLIGTPEYMAPEQFSEQPVSASTDVYALGIMLYRVFCGRPPFQGNAFAIFGQHLRDAPPPMGSWGQPIPPGVEAVVLKALAKAPRDRYQSAGELAAALSRALRSAVVLEQARAALARGDLDQAEQLAGDLLRTEPDNTAARELEAAIRLDRQHLQEREEVTSLLGTGDWRAALARIEQTGMRDWAFPEALGLARQAESLRLAEQARAEAERLRREAREQADRERAQREARERAEQERQARQRAEREREQELARELQARERTQRQPTEGLAGKRTVPEPPEAPATARQGARSRALPRNLAPARLGVVALPLAGLAALGLYGSGGLSRRVSGDSSTRAAAQPTASRVAQAPAPGATSIPAAGGPAVAAPAPAAPATTAPMPTTTPVPPAATASPADRLKVAWELIAAQQYQAAIAQLDALRLSDPGTAGLDDALYQAHLGYGKALLDQDNLDASYAEYGAALQLKADDPAALDGQKRVVLAKNWNQMEGCWGKDDECATAALEEIWSIDPSYRQTREKLYGALIAKADRMLNAGDRDAAFPVLMRALDVYPDRGEARTRLESYTPTPAPTPTPVRPQQPQNTPQPQIAPQATSTPRPQNTPPASEPGPGPFKPVFGTPTPVGR